MKWSKQRPAQEGWFWWREKPDDDPMCIQVYFASGLFWAWNEGKFDIGDENRVDEIAGEWAGPIPLPEGVP